MSEHLGTYTALKRHRNSRFNVDQIFEIEVTKETLLETEGNMKDNTSKFFDKFKGKLSKKAGSTEQVQNPFAESELDAKFREVLLEAVAQKASQAPQVELTEEEILIRRIKDNEE